MDWAIELGPNQPNSIKIGLFGPIKKTIETKTKIYKQKHKL